MDILNFLNSSREMLDQLRYCSRTLDGLLAGLFAFCLNIDRLTSDVFEACRLLARGETDTRR